MNKVFREFRVYDLFKESAIVGVFSRRVSKRNSDVRKLLVTDKTMKPKMEPVLHVLEYRSK